MAAAVSVTGTLEVVALAGLELTPVTLPGLALGLAFVLDDAVTVREAIVRQTELGADHGSAASRGAMTVVRGMALAAVAAVGVFGPASSIGGSSGRWFAGISLVVLYAVGVSAVVASILVPALSVSVGSSPRGKCVLGGWSRRVGIWFETLADRYHELLAWSLEHRRPITAITVTAALALATSIATGVVAAGDPSSIDLELRGPDAHTLFGVAQRVADELREIDGVSAPVLSTTAGSDGESLARIDHVDGGRVVRLQATVHRRRLSDVVTDIDAALLALPLPPGYDARYSGEIADRSFTNRRFARAIGIALALVAALLGIRFRTLLAPAAILAAVSAAWAGGYLALLVTGMRLDIPTLIAGAFLTVLVVRLGVQLLTAYRDCRAHDANDRVSLIEAGRARLRPTFISTVAMAGALLPLGLVSGEHRALAIALVGGVIGASVATLVVAPTTYSLLEDVALVLATRFRAGLALGKRRIRALPGADDEGVVGS
jgi:multidrug efflux pump subunit AcrB